MEDVIKTYILQFPNEMQSSLFGIKDEIEKTIPEATPRIAWNMPTYTVGNTDVIHFSAQKTFISLHIGIGAIDFFRDKLKQYSITKSTIHLDFNDKVPRKLIREIINYNMVNGFQV